MFARVPNVAGYRTFLHVDEVRRLLGAVGPLPRTLIFTDATTGLRQSELLGLRRRDLDFRNRQISVVRFVVHGVISNCKTEASTKPIPMVPLWLRYSRNEKMKLAKPVLMIGCSQVYGLKERGLCGDRASCARELGQ